MPLLRASVKTDRQAAARVALLYLIFAALWIFASDRLLALIVADPQKIAWIGTAKGISYVIVTTILLYLLLRAWSSAGEGGRADLAEMKPRHLIAAFVGLALVVPMLGYGVIRLEGPRIRAEAFSDLGAIADLKVSEIESWLNERWNDAEALKVSESLIGDLDRWQRTRDRRAGESVVERLELLKNLYHHDIQLLDPEGHRLLAPEGQPDTLNGIRKTLLPAVGRWGQIQVSDMYRDKAGQIRLDYLVPLVKRGEGPARAVAVAVLRAPVEAFLYPLIQTWPTPSPSAETLLIRREGNDVLYLNELRHHKEAALTFRLPLDTPGLPAAIAARSEGRTKSAEGRDYRGTSVLAAIRPVRGTPWLLIAKVDRDEVMRPLHYLVFWVSLVALAAVAAVATAVVLLWRREQRAHRLELIAKAAEQERAAQAALRSSEQRLSRLIDSAMDAIISLDESQHVVLFNPAAEHMFGLPASEALGQPIGRFIPERFRPAHAGHIEEFARTGVTSRSMGSLGAISGLRANGDEFPIEASISQIEVEGHKLFTVILRDITDRRRAEEALGRQLDLNQRYLDTVQTLIVALDANGCITMINRKGCETLGYAEDELLGRNWFETCLPRPEGTDGIYPVFRQIMSGELEAVEYFENAIRCSDGRLRLIAWHNAVLTDDHGNIVGALSSGEDITERKQAEEALRDSQADLTRAQTVGHIGSWRLDVRRNELTWSPENHRIFGIPEGTPMTYETFLSCAHPDDREYVDRMWQAGLRGEPYDIEHRLVVDGKVKWVREKAELEFDETGELLGGFGTTQDITERKQVEERLRVQLRLTHAITDCAADSIFVTDGHGRTTFVNAEAERAFGYSADELIGKVLHDVIHDHYPDGRPFPFSECPNCRIYVSGETVRNNEEVFFRKDGSPVTVACSNAPLEIGGEPKGSVLVAHDISELKRAGEALREADRRKDEFLAMLAHELRNPLAPIRNAAYLLGRLDLKEPRVSWAHRIIEQQVTHLSRLVDDLLDVSRIVQGKVILKKEVCELAAVVRNAVEAARPLIDGKGHSLGIRLPDKAVRVECDTVRLSQVLLNLLDNAAKYTPNGGRIEVEAGTPGPEIEIAVRDNGIGISAELLPRVFDLFQQGERALDRAQGGLGIGLTLVKRLVEMHGGRVAATSAGPGQGSEFKIWLPAVSGGSAADGKGVREPAPAAASRRVLVVDDDPAVADSMTVLLQIDGHDVKAAATGQEAMEIARTFHPQLVLVDIGLGDMDGYEVARRLRAQQPEGERMCLVAVTGYGHDEARTRSEDAGFDQHLVKPVDPDAIYALLAEVG